MSGIVDGRRLSASRGGVDWLCDAPSRAGWLACATWAFVGLGVLLRLTRYLMDYPLWWDEAFVAVNFIRRDYLDLLRPLDYGQVCPILFLWCRAGAGEASRVLGVVAAAVSRWFVRSPVSCCSVTWRAESCAECPCCWQWRSSRRRFTRFFTPPTSSLMLRTCWPP